MGRQHQIDEQQGERKDDDARIAGQNLLIGQVRPFKGDAVRQCLVGDTLDRRLRLTRREARRRAAIDVGGEEAVIARGALRPRGAVDLQQGRKRDHLPGARADLELADILGPGAKGGIGLDPDTVGAAKRIEVVDVERAEIDLQGLEHVSDRHAKLLRLRAVEIGIELRHVDLEAGEQARKLRRLVCLAEERLGRLVQRLVPEAGTILDL